MRDEFPASVKRDLAERAGFRCSFPGCDAVTIGPSDESARATANTGEACHIAAASGGPGARRVVPSMARADRVSYDNGIWMCRTHGTLIDTDEVRFTIPLLKQWRSAAERRAAILQARESYEPDLLDLFEYALVVTKRNLQEEAIGNAFTDAGIPAFWGAETASAVRDFAFEIAQNALTHGGASAFTILFTPKLIRLLDDGAAFDPRSLRGNERRRGGAMAVGALYKALGDRLILDVRRTGSGNETTIQFVRTQSDITSSTPCHLRLDYFPQSVDDVLATEEFYELEGCSTLYVLLPRYVAYSKVVSFNETVTKESLFGGQRIVFVGEEISQGVRELL